MVSTKWENTTPFFGQNPARHKMMVYAGHVPTHFMPEISRGIKNDILRLYTNVVYYTMILILIMIHSSTCIINNIVKSIQYQLRAICTFLFKSLCLQPFRPGYVFAGHYRTLHSAGSGLNPCHLASLLHNINPETPLMPQSEDGKETWEHLNWNHPV